MKARFIVIALLALVTATAAIAEEPKPSPASEPEPPVPSETNSPTVSEPIVCFRLVGLIDDEISVGLATDLCGGTTDARATLSCYREAFNTRESGGLGLHRGGAVALCRAAGAPRQP
jgi:hypothetical protein